MTRRTWVLWCTDVRSVPTGAAETLAHRVEAGDACRMAVLDPRPGPDAVDPARLRAGELLAELADPHLVTWDAATRLLTRMPGALLPGGWRPRPSATSAPWVAESLLAGSIQVSVDLDPASHDLVARLTGGPLLDVATAVAMAEAIPRWELLDELLELMTSRPDQHRPRPSELFAALDDLAEDGSLAAPPPVQGEQATRLAGIRTVARRLVRHHDYAKALELTDRVIPLWDPPAATGLPALVAHARTSLTGVPDPELHSAAAGVLAGADEALAQADFATCAELIVIGVGLLLHRDLHAETGDSPLMDDPASFLAPLRSSTAMTALASPTLLAATSPSDRPVAGGPTRVLVLPGAYPRFVTPLIEALREQAGVDVEVLRLPEHYRFFDWLGTDPELVRLRLLASHPAADPSLRDPAELSAEFTVLAPHLELLRRADVVIADWADKGAMWATLFARADTRLVLRVHGMDALSLWIHALDWSRIDALVSVSAHQAALVRDVLEHGAAHRHSHVRCQVVHNIVELPVLEDPPQRAPHTLGLVGWGKEVKDPLWALEVLALLRARGGPWRLRLVGPGPEPGRVVTSNEYAERLTARLAMDDVAGAVDVIPYTDDVAAEVARMGFILSASRRESFHLGLVEGVLGGAVPVVRNWPFYARQGGAAALFPPTWVVDDPAAAADRIWSLREESDRAREAAAARTFVRERFDPQRTRAELVDVVLGR